MNEAKIILGLTLMVLVVACSSNNQSQSSASSLCVQVCEERLNAGEDLSKGPCLDNKIIDDWVCDVAHFPRQAVDNEPENQCPEYSKSAKHFVEVDPKCKLIRVV